jgi:hypothetical protein
MQKVIVSMDGLTVQELVLTQDRTTLGRRPYNTIVIENLAVSGEHAVLLKVGEDVFVEDLNSTNGTFVNGLPIKKQLLRHGDSIDIGKHKVRFEQVAQEPIVPLPTPAALPTQVAVIKVMTGAAAGRELPLTKAVTTIGKPGVAVAAITSGIHGFTVHHVEGADKPTLNGVVIGSEPMSLKDSDLIQLAGTQMQFLQR